MINLIIDIALSTKNTITNHTTSIPSKQSFENDDALVTLSDQVMKLMTEVQEELRSSKNNIHVF